MVLCRLKCRELLRLMAEHLRLVLKRQALPLQLLIQVALSRRLVRRGKCPVLFRERLDVGPLGGCAGRFGFGLLAPGRGDRPRRLLVCPEARREFLDRREILLLTDLAFLEGDGQVHHRSAERLDFLLGADGGFLAPDIEFRSELRVVAHTKVAFTCASPHASRSSRNPP